MRPSAAVPAGSRRGMFVVGVIFVVMVAGACGRSDDTRTDTTQAVDTSRAPTAGAPADDPAALSLAACNPPERVSAASHGRLVTWARSLSYGTAAGTEPPNAYGWESVPGARVQVHATTDNARFSRQALRRGCLIGRLISNRADTALGVTADTNYIWLDSAARGFQATVIPRRTSAPLKTVLAAVINRHVRPSAGYIIRKPQCYPCGSDWCYSPRDTLPGAYGGMPVMPTNVLPRDTAIRPPQ